MRPLRAGREEHGVPCSVYVDRDSIYRCERAATVAEQVAGQEPQTQFGRAMRLLGVELILANSPQAKGRVERRNGLLQDPLAAGADLLFGAGLNRREAQPQGSSCLDTLSGAEHPARHYDTTARLDCGTIAKTGGDKRTDRNASKRDRPHHGRRVPRSNRSPEAPGPKEKVPFSGRSHCCCRPVG